jgi:hypothetical protein
MLINCSELGNITRKDYDFFMQPTKGKHIKKDTSHTYRDLGGLLTFRVAEKDPFPL